MPEQFSEEYIAEVKKHPWLQEMWLKRGPQVGDWVWIPAQGGMVCLVTTTKKSEKMLGARPVDIALEYWYFWERVLWLPTLGKLIEIAKNLALRGNVIGLRLDYWAVEEIYEWALKKMTSGNIHHSFPGASEDCFDA